MHDACPVLFCVPSVVLPAACCLCLLRVVLFGQLGGVTSLGPWRVFVLVVFTYRRLDVVCVGHGVV